MLGYIKTNLHNLLFLVVNISYKLLFDIHEFQKERQKGHILWDNKLIYIKLYIWQSILLCIIKKILKIYLFVMRTLNVLLNLRYTLY